MITATSYLAKILLGFSGEEAIHWVRRYIPKAIESEEQKNFIVEDRK
jgi:hypothetical protein